MRRILNRFAFGCCLLSIPGVGSPLFEPPTPPKAPEPRHRVSLGEGTVQVRANTLGKLQTWDGDKLIRIGARGGCLNVTERKNGRPFTRAVPLPERGKLLSASSRGWFAARQEPAPEGRGTTARIYRLEGLDWKPSFRLNFQLLQGFWELTNGRFLAMALPGFERAGHISPFAILKASEDQWLEVEELVEAISGCFVPPEQWKPPFQPSRPSPGGLIPNLLPEWRPLAADLIAPLLITTENRITFLSGRAGVAFVLDGDTGRFLRRVPLYPAHFEKPFKNQPKDAPILFAQPLPSGEIFLAARTEDAVIAGPKVFLEPATRGHGTQDPARYQAMDRAQKELVKAYGEIRYLLFDPNLGKFADTFRPDGMPATLGSMELAKDFAFHVDLSGKIRHGAPPEEGTRPKSPPPGPKK